MKQNQHTFVVEKVQEGQRLDLVIGQALALSRAQLKELFEADAVKVNGRKAKKGQSVLAGQTVQVDAREEAGPALQPQKELSLSVLYEDSELLFLDKPSGQPSHPLKPGETGTLANAIVARYPECASASLDEREGGLCHRLDIETSGVVWAARNRKIWEWARQLFSNHDVDKRYWAVVTGPLADEGEIEVPLMHHPRHPDRVIPATDDDAHGRPAHSYFSVRARRGEYSLVEVKIVTGVLHQVRAHLAAVGAPIVGDTLYGGRALPGLNRFFLHARSLTIPHPKRHTPQKVESPLPTELTEVLNTLGLTHVSSPGR